MLQTIVVVFGLGLLCVASLQDWATRVVPNFIPVSIALAGVVARLSSGTLLAGLFAGLAVFAIATGCWRMGWLGGADVKLFGAGALLLPPTAAMNFVLTSCLAGGVLAVIYVGLGYVVPHPRAGRLTNWLRRYVRLAQWRLKRRGSLPYATAIAAGACCVFLGG